MWKKILLFYLRRIKKLNTPREIIDFAFKRYRDKTFLIQPDNNIEFSFGDVKTRVEKIVSFLLDDAKVKKGDTIAFFSRNCFEYFEVRAAAHLLGCVFFSIPTYLAQENIIYFLNKSRAKIVFYRAGNEFDINAIKKNTNVNYFINFDNASYQDIFQKQTSSQKITVGTETTVTLNLSSGTTKKTPKIIQLTAKNWTASLYNYILNSDIKPNKNIIFLCALPFATAGSTTFLPLMLAGITSVILTNDFSPRMVIDYIKRYKINRLYITPSWLIELFECCKQNNERLSCLENIIIGTESMPHLRLKETIEFFGPKISVGYGMVEVLPPITLLSPKDYYVNGQLKNETLGSVGKVLKGITVKVLDENSNEVSPGRTGIIAIKSLTVSKGYLDNENENLKCFRNGWFYTSDYGFFDKGGYLHILGRKEEIISREGRLYFAKELEDKLYELSFIKRCAAVKQTTEDREQATDKKQKNNQISLFVSLREEIDEKEAKDRILKFCEKNIDEFLMPDDIIIKEDLPVSPLGKLDRKRLKE